MAAITQIPIVFAESDLDQRQEFVNLAWQIG
jgi:hypothetical protein